MKRTSYVMFCAFFVMALALSACGGGGGTGSPADAVKGFFEAVFAGKGDVNQYVCASAAAGMKQSFEAMKQQLSTGGATIDVSGLKYETTSQSGDTAKVKVSGKLKVTIGGNSNEQDFPIPEVPVKNESGWKVCG